MKVKGGGRRKSWETEAVAVAVSVEDQHLGGDSLPNPPNDVPQLQSDAIHDEDADEDCDNVE